MNEKLKSPPSVSFWSNYEIQWNKFTEAKWGGDKGQTIYVIFTSKHTYVDEKNSHLTSQKTQSEPLHDEMMRVIFLKIPWMLNETFL